MVVEIYLNVALLGSVTLWVGKENKKLNYGDDTSKESWYHIGFKTKQMAKLNRAKLFRTISL